MALNVLRKIKRAFEPPKQRPEDYIAALRQEGALAFIHINKCGGTSVEKALGIPKIHDTALQRIEKIGRDRWDALTTFTIVRHPYSKVASHYRYRVKTAQTGLEDRHIDMNDWIRESYGAKNPQYYDQPLMFAPCVEWISDAAGAILVDHILKLESIDADWASFRATAGVKADLPHQNKTAPEAPEFAPDALEIIQTHFAQDFDTLGYAR